MRPLSQCLSARDRLLNVKYGFTWIEDTIEKSGQESIPVGCAPPAFLIRGEGSLSSGGLCRDTLDTDPIGHRSPGQRPLWTETTLDTDPVGHRSPGQRPLWTETTLDTDPIGHRPPWTENPQTGSDIIQRPLPTLDRMTDTRFWKYYLAPNFVWGR